MRLRPGLLLLLVALPALLMGLAPTRVRSEEAEEAWEDPTAIVNDQIAAIGSVSPTDNDTDVLDWLGDMDEVLGRVALGALPALPPNAFKALETLNNSVATPERLNRSDSVVRSLLHVVPSLWAMAFWYMPLDEWRPAFESLFSRSVAAAKRDAKLYEVAVNTTTHLVRFTKDSVFFTGEDPGDKQLNLPGAEYLEMLPTLLADVSTVPGWEMTTIELREFMERKLHSKRDGMNMDVPFPTFVDTAQFFDDDVQEIGKLLKQDPAA